MLKQQDFRRLQQALGYDFKDEQLLAQALTHRSAASNNNERLEFLGDAILGFEIAENLFRLHAEAKEGQLSRSRAQLVKGETLAKLGRKLELGQYLILGPGELRSGGHNRDSIISDAVEAIIAAVFIDGGMDEARTFVRRILKERIASIAPMQQQKDAKTRLQELLQARNQKLPDYAVLSVKGDPHQQLFKVSCELRELGLLKTAKGATRRKAEQQAAEKILSQLGEAE